MISELFDLTSKLQEDMDFVTFSVMDSHYLFCAKTSEYFRITDCAKYLLDSWDFTCGVVKSDTAISGFSKPEIESTQEQIQALITQGKISRRINLKTVDPGTSRDITLKIISTFRCNLHCSYCFTTNKDGSGDMSLETAKKSIDFFLKHFYKGKQRVIIDFSGAGEPLLRIDFLLEVNSYLRTIRNDFGIDIFMQLATNGMLLSKSVSEKLKNENILFGVSLDGNQQASERMRNGINYPLVVNNIEDIQNKQFFGLAATFSGASHDIQSIFESLFHFGPEVVSIKPARITSDHKSAISETNIKSIKDSYTQFCSWLISMLSKGHKNVFFAVIGGDDYFGKFLKLLSRRSRQFYRCSAGLNSVAVDTQGELFICPAMINEKELVLGNIETGFIKEKQQQLKSLYADNISYCQNCWARYLCGGECFSLSYSEHKELGKPISAMCELNKHLIHLSIHFWITIASEQKSQLSELLLRCRI